MPHKLLLADDSVTIQRVIELTFADEDVQVITVSNGQEAIDRAQRDRPDIVLADIGMPERNGYEVAAFIKSTPALAGIPVVLLTGAFEPIDEGRARAVGCDGVLVKPFEPQLVISRVKDLLAGKHPQGMWSAAPAAQGPVRQAPTFDLPARPAAAAGAAPAAGAAANDSLEAYFDHLDAAFAAAGGAAEPAAPSEPLAFPPLPPRTPAAAPAVDDLGAWDPDLVGDATRPAARFDPPLVFPPSLPPRSPAADGMSLTPAVAASTPAAATTMAAAAPQPSVAPASTVSTPGPVAAPAPAAPPSLAEAFAALLAAEQQVGFKPSSAAIPPPPAAALAPVLDDRAIDAIVTRVLARVAEDARPLVLDTAERVVREELDRIKKHL